MMEQNKKGFSVNLWPLVLVALVTAVLIHFTTHSSIEIKGSGQTTITPEVTEVEEKIDYNKDVMLNISHASNTCAFHDSQYFTEVITVSYPEEEGTVAGRWIDAENRIQLMVPKGLDILTVAHEVSHAVDSILGRQAANMDPHYEAYLQGVLTSCVASILEQDLKEANISKFGW